MADEQTRGCRLLASVIESYAINDAGTVWASIPKDDDDLSKGFVDLTYKEFGNAINHTAWWLKEHLHEDSTRFETLAYTGPKDLRYPILAVAALKMGKQVYIDWDSTIGLYIDAKFSAPATITIRNRNCSDAFAERYPVPHLSLCCYNEAPG